MISFKGILKYLIYIFIAGWMFVLGIMVGRGSSPVEFDTRKFQKRLETIAGEFGKKKIEQKIDLKFYDVLDQPVQEGAGTPGKISQEIIPKKETTAPVATADTMPFKTSRKKMTLKTRPVKTKEPSAAVISGKKKGVIPASVKKKSTDLKTAKPSVSAPDKKAPKGNYTVQIAAYKNFKDAVSQMVLLEKKGISSYRIKGLKDGQTWYRVRSGSFVTYDEAKKFKAELQKVKIKSMIIKKGRQ